MWRWTRLAFRPIAFPSSRLRTAGSLPAAWRRAAVVAAGTGDIRSAGDPRLHGAVPDVLAAPPPGPNRAEPDGGCAADRLCKPGRPGPRTGRAQRRTTA